MKDARREQGVRHNVRKRLCCSKVAFSGYGMQLWILACLSDVVSNDWFSHLDSSIIYSMKAKWIMFGTIKLRDWCSRKVWGPCEETCLSLVFPTRCWVSYIVSLHLSFFTIKKKIIKEVLVRSFSALFLGTI